MSAPRLARRWPALLAAMLSLSIGWGIRGNFGHEAGAMLPGALCAIAVCLFSGRDDWHRRVTFFAMFGALGWAFGGSIAYMPPLSYTHSGHLPTQIYGWFGVFVIGFLWAGMGGAGTAYAALERPRRLAEILKPLAFILAIWAAEYIWQDTLIAWYERAHNAAIAGSSDFRHNDPFYWLDSEWIEASLALLALCAFDLWDRRFAKIQWLAALAAAGAALGWAVQRGLAAAGWLASLLALLVRPQGDAAWINPATGHPHDAAQFVTNWPQVFFDLGPHMGWILGLLAGAALYFRVYGRWRSGASLLLHITLGSLIVFIAGPVLLSGFFQDFGGFRLTPPRGDSWANILGAYLGMTVYMKRNGLGAVASSAFVSAVLGGLGLMVAQFLKLLAFMPGNPVLTSAPAVIARWAHWHGANWHSLLTEQGVGLLYGLAIALPLFRLAAVERPREDDAKMPAWAHAFAVVFVLNVIPYLNLAKNPGTWVSANAMPPSMKAPLFGGLELTSEAWFAAAFMLAAICTITVLARHIRRPVAAIPSTWTGRAQLLYLALLWIMVVGNFERALVGFREQRLGTEGVIFVNAILATLLILLSNFAPRPAMFMRSFTPRVAFLGFAALILFTAAFTVVVRGVYGDRPDGWGRPNYRFGPDADWRVRPLLKNEAHR